MALIGTLAVAIVCGALCHEHLLDALHAARTGYHFEWMPEGVTPAPRRAINNAGQVAVNVYESGPNTKAAVWSIDEPRVRLLGTVPGAHDYSVAMAIGEDGSIVGVFNEPGGVFTSTSPGGFFWSESTGMVEVSNPDGGLCCAAAVNRNGEVAGVVFGPGPRGFRWARDSGVVLLDQLPGRGGELIYDINDKGWVVGGTGSTPVLWKARTPRDLGLPPGYSHGTARAINTRGQILVACHTGGAQPYVVEHPFVWSEESGYVAYPVPEGCTEMEALGLDDAGQVLLRATRLEDGAVTAFLLGRSDWRPLPPARFGLSTIYVGLNDRGWLTGLVHFRATDGPDPTDRGFVARP